MRDPLRGRPQIASRTIQELRPKFLTLFIISINSRINISECVCAIFGLILNTISVIILSKLIQIDRRNKSERKIIYYLLVALAVFDNFYLSSVILKETTL